MNEKRKCPECDGKGWIGKGASSYLKFALFNIPSSSTEDCEKCKGTGYIKNEEDYK